MVINWLPSIPASNDRDIALGQFMSAWGYLEMQLMVIFYLLIGTPYEIAYKIFNTGFQSSTLVDLLKALGQTRLIESEQQQLNSLCRRYSNAALKRNKIVHGNWVLETNPKDSFPTQWVRVCIPINPTLQKQIDDKFNQKTRRKYRFTIEQLLECCENINSLSNDMKIIGGMIMGRLYPDKLP